MRYTTDQIHRKMRKVARRLAEANTWKDSACTKTKASLADAWIESFQLIKMLGLMPEYEKRAKQVRRGRMP